MTKQANHASSDAVHATVCFADLFGLPIDVDRLHCSLIRTPMSLLETSMAVDELVSKGQLVRRDDLVCLAGRESIFDDHITAVQRTTELWPLAEKWAQRVGRIPFVRMVAATGGLARDALGPDDPIDLFIIVRPRRLWITRLLILRVLRQARQEGLIACPAYIATTRTPEIEPRSMATAWELAHLAVVIGENVSRTVRRSNDWIFEWLPNASIDGNLEHHIAYEPSSTQKWTESLLLLPPFRVIENWTRHRQIAHLLKATRKRDTSRPGELSDRFSMEICDERLGLQAALTERAWNAATNNP